MENLLINHRCQQDWKNASELKQIDDELTLKPLQPIALHHFLPQGIKRGTIFEVYGRRSSGRTAVSQHILGSATTAGEVCAVVDLADSFHPASACAAGVQLNRIVWVRCGRNPEYAMRACDLLLHAGGFGVVNLDLCGADPRTVHKIPVSYWYRFRNAIERTPTVLLVCGDLSHARSCSHNGLQTQLKAASWLRTGPLSLLRGIDIHAVASKTPFLRPFSSFLKRAV
jgi:recA bacterial DNA recombination protein